MVRSLRATFDGEVLRPEEPLPIEPDTLVEITVEIPEPSASRSYSFLRAARALGLEGPPDWSEQLEEHLYGERAHAGDAD